MLIFSFLPSRNFNHFYLPPSYLNLPYCPISSTTTRFTMSVGSIILTTPTATTTHISARQLVGRPSEGLALEPTLGFFGRRLSPSITSTSGGQNSVNVDILLELPDYNQKLPITSVRICYTSDIAVISENNSKKYKIIHETLKMHHTFSGN